MDLVHRRSKVKFVTIESTVFPDSENLGRFKVRSALPYGGLRDDGTRCTPVAATELMPRVRLPQTFRVYPIKSLRVSSRPRAGAPGTSSAPPNILGSRCPWLVPIYYPRPALSSYPGVLDLAHVRTPRFTAGSGARERWRSMNTQCFILRRLGSHLRDHSHAFRAAGVSTGFGDYPIAVPRTPGVRDTRHLAAQRFSRLPWPPRATIQRQSRPLLVSFDTDQLPRKRRETQASRDG